MKTVRETSGIHSVVAVPLDQLAPGRSGVVEAVLGRQEARRRLLEMGLCPGVTVEMLRRAPFGDPLEFRLRGYLLSLRGEQAKLVAVLPRGTQP